MRFIEPKVRQALWDVEHFVWGVGNMMLDVDSYKSINDKNWPANGLVGKACLRSEPVKRSSYFVCT